MMLCHIFHNITQQFKQKLPNLASLDLLLRQLTKQRTLCFINSTGIFCGLKYTNLGVLKDNYGKIFLKFTKASVIKCNIQMLACRFSKISLGPRYSSGIFFLKHIFTVSQQCLFLFTYILSKPTKPNQKTKFYGEVFLQYQKPSDANFPHQIKNK